MKKSIKRLTLSRETVKFLTPEALENAGGGTHATVWSACMCTNYSACCSGECGTALCW